jgi:tol-pal system protein YbgF
MRRKTLFRGLLGVLVLAGCVPTADFTELRDEVRQLQAENKKLRESETELQKQIPAMQTTVGDLKGRYQSLDQKVGEVLQQTYENSRLIENLTSRMEETATRIPPKPSSTTKPSASPGGPPTSPSGLESQAVLTPTASFNLAYNDYLKGNYDLAVAGFESFLRQFPSTSLAAHAQYWIGESYANKREYRSAIEAYDKLTTNYPKSDKVPAALYKAATGYAELGDLAKARSLFKRVIEDHPQSDEATRAKQRLAELR